MENVILIQVETIADLETLQMNQNFICIVTTTGEIFRGDGENPPIKMIDEKNSTFANHFLFMGA